MGLVLSQIQETLSQAVFSPETLLSSRGALHMAQIIFCLVTFILGIFRGGHIHSYWNYAMFSWSFCPIITLVITIIELFKLDILLNMFCMDWPDFTTGIAMTFSLMTGSVFITYANFYACPTCFYAWVVSAFALVCAILYILEVVKDKCWDGKKGSYLAAMCGFWKVLEAFVSCMIYTALTGYHGKVWLILCVVAYAIPFPIIPVIIIVNILKKLKACLPFNLDKFTFGFLVASVIVYVFAAVVWPIVIFRDNPRPSECPGDSCIWAIEFMVTFFTYVNLVLFLLDLIFTVLGLYGFKRT